MDLRHRLFSAVFILTLVPLIIMTSVFRVIPELRVMATPTLCISAAAMFFTDLILVGWLYRSIVKPLDILTVATQHIKEGDLDYSIRGETDDEMGQLCNDFEEMRTHLKELIEVRMQYERDTADLIGNISHDLKTPLTTIKGYSEGIMDGVADSDEKREKYIKMIYSKACEMAVLVDELAFYTKLDFNEIPYDFEHVEVNGYFDACAEELEIDLELKGFSFSYENLSRDDNMTIVADREQMMRVINNLISNSVKYMDKKNGEIGLRIKREGKNFIVEVFDNGMGIPEDDLQKIFDRLYRADSSRNSKRGGSGLGLAICKKIVEEHDGKIWAESRLGEGTSLFFSLPVCRIERKDETSDTTTEKPQNNEGENKREELWWTGRRGRLLNKKTQFIPKD